MNIGRLTEPYKSIWEIGNATGLRISDIVRLTVGQIRQEKPTVTEQKTGKRRRIYIPRATRARLMEISKNKRGYEYVFPGIGKSGHITRQAVHRAFKRAAAAAGVEQNIGTHTMRKNYALRQYNRGGMKYAQTKLNHAAMAETYMYVMGDGKNG